MRGGIGQRIAGSVAELGNGCHGHPVRTFLAIPVRPPALEAFHTLRERLVSDIPAVRWTAAESPHITLHFFGSISAPESERALEALRPILAAQRPMTLRLHGLGSFTSAADPRVLWCGVDGDVTELTACALACRWALSTAGFSVEDRPYRAHCTLGRPRRPWPAHARECWRRQAQEGPSTPSFTADRAMLYESLTAMAGVIHVPREVLTLGAAPLRSTRGRPSASAPRGG
jgi:2'-5' RNA ligase